MVGNGRDLATCTGLDGWDWLPTFLFPSPRQVADEMAGHISAAMRKRYSHQLIESMRQAVDAAELS